METPVFDFACLCPYYQGNRQMRRIHFSARAHHAFAPRLSRAAASARLTIEKEGSRLKRIAALLLTLVLAFSVTAAMAEESALQIDFEVEEASFLTQVTDVYINTPDYLGKTIALEGLMDVYTYVGNGITYRTVYRNHPGCCGNDGYIGLEVIWEDAEAAYPEKNEWVRAVGVLEQYDDEGYPYLRLRLESIDVLAERGLEFVTQ